MPVCQSCGKEWTWKQTMKTLFKLKCPYCGEKQYESAKSRMKNGMISVLISLIAMLAANILLDLSLVSAIIFGLLAVVILLSVYPFVLKLSNEEEPYW